MAVRHLVTGRLAALAIAVTSVIAGTATPAAAESAAESAFGAVVRAGATANNVITCTTQIQYPHESHHVPGTANVVTTASCTAPVSSISMTVRLYYNGVLVNSRSFFRAGAAFLSGNAAATCVPGYYQGTATVTYIAPPGYTPPSATHNVASPSLLLDCV